MLTLDPINSGNTIIIQDNLKSNFCSKVEKLLLSPPEWVSQHVQTVRETLTVIPSEMSSNYSYSPNYNFNGVRIEFKCAKNNFKLTLKKDEASFESVLNILQTKSHSTRMSNQPEKKSNDESSNVTYSGPVTPASVNQFPQDLQKYAEKLSQNDLPFTVTITNNGSVKVESSVSFADESFII